VKTAASSGYLLRITELYAVLWFWSQWGDSADVAKWVTSAVRDDGSAPTVLCAMVQESSSQTLGDYHVQDNSRIDRKTLEQFSPWSEWQALDHRLSNKPEHTAAEQRAFRLLKKAIAEDSARELSNSS
jgi:hypothetical protein